MNGGAGLGRRSLRSGPGLGLGLLVTAAGAFLLSSCGVPSIGVPSTGIPSTGVVEAGEAATGIMPIQVIYFVREGSLVGIRQRTPGPSGIGTAMQTLFRGPGTEALRRELTTELPPLTTAPTVRTDGTDGANVTIELPRGTEPLTRTALAQLTCTVTDALLLTSSTTATEPTPALTPAPAPAPKTKLTVMAPDTWQSEGSSEPCPGPEGMAVPGQGPAASPP